MASMMKAILICVLMAGFVAAPASQKNAGESPRSEQEDNIREAVFRYQFKNFELLVAYRFISVYGKNPSAAMLQRFHGEQPPVLSVSESEKIKKPMKLIQNRNDYKQGALFNQGQIKWISDTKADIDGNFECGDICDEASGVYHASRQENKWVVDSFDASATAAKPKK
jgi:hypothetical protein